MNIDVPSNEVSPEKAAALADDAFISDSSENDSETEKAAEAKAAAKERKPKKRKYRKRDEKIEVSIGDVVNNK